MAASAPKPAKQPKGIVLRWPASVPIDHISVEFLQGMLDRMAMGFHNYGHTNVNFPDKHDALKNLRRRLREYRRTKNTEFLMDAANYCMIEFKRPKLRGAFFEPTPKAKSPGSVRGDGKIVKGKEEDY